MNTKKRKPFVKKFKTILKSGVFIMGEEVEIFEKNIAKYTKSKYCVGVGSGTDALILTLMAYDIKKGDEVIVPNMSFIATANAVSQVGAKVVFCDISNDLNIDVSKIKNLITSKTKAIIPVHYGGKIADMNAIMTIAKKHNLIVIEDASQAFGSKINDKHAGTMGNIGCFSLNPMKSLGALGDAGVILTSCKKIYNKLKALRCNGLDENKRCIYKSLNAKIDSLQASFLNIQLKTLDKTIIKRTKYAKFYDKYLSKNCIIQKFKENEKSNIYSYTILVDKIYRDKLYQYLIFNNIEAKINHLAMHQEPAYQDEKYTDLENSQRISKMKIAIPCHENLKKKEIKYVATTIQNFFKQNN
jgi:dTDP-4-amino-4,6-dideoxygalactose transaminase